MKVSRLDSGRIDAAERTQQGFLKAPAYLTRAGVFTYTNADGSQRREWRSMAEVMRADSLASLISAPVTDKHPAEMVTAENRSKYDRGNLGDNIIRDGGKVAATMYIKDSRLISAVERGDMRETSCGYNCETTDGVGVVPAGEPDAGQRYDAVQSDIVYNHVAVVPMGRAGSSIGLRLDAAGNSVVPPVEGHSNEDKMTKERIDGIEYDVGTDAHRAACARRDEADKAHATELTALKAERDRQQARADKADADALKAAEQLKAATDVRHLDALATARASLLSGALAVLGTDVKLDGKSDAEIKREVAIKANPTLKLDGKSEAYVEALFDAAILRGTEARNDGLDGLAKVRLDAATATTNAVRVDADAEWEKMVERNHNAWKQPANGAAKGA